VAVVQQLTDWVVATPATTTFAELMETLDIVPRKSQMPQRTCQPERILLQFDPGTPLSH
jgi:hypothetical protein